MRKDEFKYSTRMLTPLGCLKMPSASSSSNYCWSSSSWWQAYWGSPPFCQGRFHRTYVYFGFKQALCTVVAFDVEVEDVVVFIQQ